MLLGIARVSSWKVLSAIYKFVYLVANATGYHNLLYMLNLLIFENILLILIFIQFHLSHFNYFPIFSMKFLTFSLLILRRY